jgi:arylsulfatase A-like enzyme
MNVRRTLLLALLVAALACGGPVPRSEIPARLAALGQPNLVLIVVDTLRADYLTPYGFERDTSPELAAWAARGVLFERVRSQSSWTKMSMASLMTSLWPASHGIREAKDGLGESAVTVAEVLRDAGYTTYAVQTNGWLHQSFGFQQGFDRYVFPRGGGGPTLARHALAPR